MITRRFLQTSALGMALLLVTATAVWADDIYNDLDTTIDSTLEVMNLTAGGSTGSTIMAVQPRNDDGKNGCNLTGSTTLVTSVGSSDTSVATVSPSSLTFDSCGATRTVTVTPIAAGSAAISLSQTSNNTGGTFDLAPASFTVNVAAAPPSDTTAPTIDCTVPDQTVWYADNVTVSCTASDTGSGLADPDEDASFSLTTSVDEGEEDEFAATDTRVVCDNAENCDTAGPYTFKVDRKGPTVTCDTAPTFKLNQPGTEVSATVSDDGSGAAASPVTAAADTSNPGSGSASVTGYDNVLNSTTVSCSFNVEYNWYGFFAPVDNPVTGKMNGVKAGSAVPLKFRITDYFGVGVDTLTSVTLQVKSKPCSTTAIVDGVDEVATGASGLQNQGDGYYQFNWKTPTSYANSCRSAGIVLDDETTHVADFQFKK